MPDKKEIAAPGKKKKTKKELEEEELNKAAFSVFKGASDIRKRKKQQQDILDQMER